MSDMTEQLDAFHALYMLAADNGREQVLFGDCAQLAHQAYQRSLGGDEFPTIWFEIPLTGQPRFDLHVALSRKAIMSCPTFAPGAGNGYDALFRWFATVEKGGIGLAFAYDVCEGNIDNPAVHVNVNGAPLDDMAGFFNLAAGDGAYAAYREFEERLPHGWSVWYAGVHPGRPGSHLRVDCFVSRDVKRSYASDLALFERDLGACGFSAISPALRLLAEPILDSPFSLELQFDVARDGTVGNTLGVSASFPFAAWDTIQATFGQGGAGACLVEKVEHLGLADARWHSIPQASFAKTVKTADRTLALYCIPTFVKLRMRDGKPLDAKFYLQASVLDL